MGESVPIEAEKPHGDNRHANQHPPVLVTSGFSLGQVDRFCEDRWFFEKELFWFCRSFGSFSSVSIGPD